MKTFSSIFSLLMSILLVFGGVYCFMQPESALFSIAWGIGFMLLMNGIIGIFSYVHLPKEVRVGWSIIISLLDIAFGIWFMSANGIVVAAIALPFAFSLNMILRGIFSVIQYRDLKEILVHQKLYLFSSLISILLGLYLLANPLLAALTVVYVMGMALLFYAFTNLLIWDGIRHID